MKTKRILTFALVLVVNGLAGGVTSAQTQHNHLAAQSHVFGLGGARPAPMWGALVASSDGVGAGKLASRLARSSGPSSSRPKH